MSDEATLETVIEGPTAIEAAPAGSRILEDPRILVALDPLPLAEREAATPEAQPEITLEKPGPDWRQELAAEMQNYRTRRKPRAPKYPSLQMPLQLPTGAPEILDVFRAIPAEVSLSSNALEPLLESSVVPEPRAPQLGPELVESASIPGPQPPPVPVPAAPPTNLIEFPRSMESEAWDGLAEPLIEQPRILDAPELVPPEPALGGILLEAPQEANPHPVPEAPVRSASITRRVFAFLVDAILVACATALWGWLVSKIIHEIPPRPQLPISLAVAFAVLWLSYQYLLTVYSGTTLGLRACRIELAALDGTRLGRKQRRWRLLASLLSAASMMLGYAWVLLDESHLCWHDRITHTYLRLREGKSL